MLEALAGMASDRFHAVVTDPPYGLSEPLSGEDAAAVLAQWLVEGEYHRAKGRKAPAAPGFDKLAGPRLTGGGFLSNTWDAFVPSPRQWAEVYRVLRPGGYALVFAGTRTQGWMAISLMLAGFEVLDTLTWLGAQGFPKGGDVSKRIDKALGAERTPLGIGAAQCEYIERGEPCGHGSRDERSQSGGTVHQPATAPATDEAAQWEDWSTTLKPAHEPIIVARKPLREKSVGTNLLTWRAGALNIGACRVGDAGGTTKGTFPKGGSRGVYGNGINGACEIVDLNAGRWPANVVLSHSPECGASPADPCAEDCAAAALDAQAGERVSGSRAEGRYQQREAGDGRLYGACAPVSAEEIRGSAGGPSRFYFGAKASSADRDCGLEALPAEHPARAKRHPTVKPTALMRWLARLVCPPEWRDLPAGEVLDPFGGSGSTGVALALEGFRGVVVERDEDYAALAEARVAAALRARASGDVPRPWRERKVRPLKREGCADACAVAGVDEQSGLQRDGTAVKRNLPEEGAQQRIDVKAPTQRGEDATYGGGGGASRFFAVLDAMPDADIARREATVEGEPSSEEVDEARAVAERAAEIFADPTASADARTWAELDLRARGLLPREPEQLDLEDAIAAATTAEEAAVDVAAEAARVAPLEADVSEVARDALIKAGAEPTPDLVAEALARACACGDVLCSECNPAPVAEVEPEPEPEPPVAAPAPAPEEAPGAPAPTERPLLARFIDAGLEVLRPAGAAPGVLVAVGRALARVGARPRPGGWLLADDALGAAAEAVGALGWYLAQAPEGA